MTVQRLLINSGIAFSCGLFAWNARVDVMTSYYKIRGTTTCTWREVLAAPARSRARVELTGRIRRAVAIMKSQGNLVLFDAPRRPFWIPFAGETEKEAWLLLSNLIAEYQWEDTSGQAVRAGDVVLDCGAHVGVFTDLALSHGAGRVVAIEPDPQNLECLRRNFAPEIAQGRVVVYPMGVWREKKSLRFSTVRGNSAAGNVIGRGEPAAFAIPVTTIDAIASELRLPRVDYIKMGIQGSEREALRGALGVLRQFKPRLMIEMYHLPDDVVAIPRAVSEVNPGYVEECGPCQPSQYLPRYALVPHVVYFH